MTPTDRRVGNAGLHLDQIFGSRRKRAEYADAAQMMAEFPTTDTEAFLNTGRGVFTPEAVERLRADCTVEPRRGETDGHRFRDDSLGGLRMWRDAEDGARYVAAVDIGGRSSASDWSVIAVMRRARLPGERHEGVAQWRGHTRLLYTSPSPRD